MFLKLWGPLEGGLFDFLHFKGLVIGVFGSFTGLGLSVVSLSLVIAKTNFIYVPAEIYHVKSFARGDEIDGSRR